MKYKILGLSLIAFIVLLLFMVFKPKRGLNPVLLKSSNIDSISVIKSQDDFTIRSRSDINKITTALTNVSHLIRPDRMNINSDFYDLKFYTKGPQSLVTISILFNKYHGTVVSAGDLYYKGERLDEVIKSLRTR